MGGSPIHSGIGGTGASVNLLDFVGLMFIKG
jgi:hypothetical protein